MARELQDLKVAIVHDWLTNMGGAEKVVLCMLRAFPQADLYTSVYHPGHMPEFSKYDVKTSFLQKVPLAKKKHQLFPTLRRYAFESFDFSEYDLVITSSTAEAKGIITSESTLHISYINTPTRYFWSHYQGYLKNPGFGWLNPVARWQLKANLKSSRRWDFAAAQRADHVLGNSITVQKRIEKYYRRPADVLYPSVETSRFRTQRERPVGAPDKYFVVVSRLIPYKRFDIAVEAATRNDQSLIVLGSGSELSHLKALAGPGVQFLGQATDEELEAYVQHAEALIFPGLEDFGIVPVEAMAAGTPVIAFDQGGASETVLDGVTGILVKQQTVAAFASAMRDFRANDYETTKLKARAEEFSEKVFQHKLKSLVNSLMAGRAR